MTGNTQDNLEDAVLGRISVHDIDAGTAERIRTLAQAILARQRERAARRSVLEQAYSRFLEPALVSSVVVSYLIWAVNRALLFYQIPR